MDECVVTLEELEQQKDEALLEFFELDRECAEAQAIRDAALRRSEQATEAWLREKIRRRNEFAALIKAEFEKAKGVAPTVRLANGSEDYKAGGVCVAPQPSTVYGHIVPNQRTEAERKTPFGTVGKAGISAEGFVRKQPAQEPSHGYEWPSGACAVRKTQDSDS